MDPEYGKRYRELHERHWWWRAREAVVLRELDRLRPAAGWEYALDVGCGDGLFFEKLRRYAGSVEGIEPDTGLVTSTERAGGRIHTRPFDATFQPPHRFGLILFLDVLEHLEAPAAAVAHAASLLEEGGVVLVTVPAFMHLWTTHDDLNRHLTRYTRPRLQELLGSDLEVVHTRYFFRWVHKAKVVQKLMETVTRPEPATPQVPAGPINSLFYGLSRMEEGLLRALPIPMGSSLLGVARKV